MIPIQLVIALLLVPLLGLGFGFGFGLLFLRRDQKDILSWREVPIGPVIAGIGIVVIAGPLWAIAIGNSITWLRNLALFIVILMGLILGFSLGLPWGVRQQTRRVPRTSRLPRRSPVIERPPERQWETAQGPLSLKQVSRAPNSHATAGEQVRAYYESLGRRDFNKAYTYLLREPGGIDQAEFVRYQEQASAFVTGLKDLEVINEAVELDSGRVTIGIVWDTQAGEMDTVDDVLVRRQEGEWRLIWTNEELDASTPAPGQESKVGQEVDLDRVGLKVLVNEVRDYESTNGLIQPRPGCRFLVLDVTLTNQSEETVSHSDLDFQLQDDKYRSYNVGLTDLEPSLGYGTLQPGESVRGFLSFELPEGARPSTLVYRPVLSPQANIPL